MSRYNSVMLWFFNSISGPPRFIGIHCDRRPDAYQLVVMYPDGSEESERFDDALNNRLLEDFFALDLAVTRKLSQNARFRLAVQNLADEEIQTRLSPDPEALVYVGAPRHWTVSCEWAF